MRAANWSKDYVVLAKARSAVHREANATKLMDAVSPAMREDPAIESRA